MPQPVRLVHTAFGIHRQGILKVHHLWNRRAAHQCHRTHHLAVKHIGHHLPFELLVAATGLERIPVAYLQRLGVQVVPHYILVIDQAGGMHHPDVAAEWLQLLDMFRQHLGMRHAEKVYLIMFGQLLDLMIGAQLVAFLKRVRESGQYNQYLHNTNYSRVSIIPH